MSLAASHAFFVADALDIFIYLQGVNETVELAVKQDAAEVGFHTLQYISLMSDD